MDPQAQPAWWWAGTARKHEKVPARSWVLFGAAVLGVTAAAIGVGQWSEDLGELLFVAGYGVVVSLGIARARKVGPPKPFRLDWQGFWFDGHLLVLRQDIRGFEVVPPQQASHQTGVSIAGFEGGFQVHSLSGKHWFEACVAPGLWQVAMALGLRVWQTGKTVPA